MDPGVYCGSGNQAGMDITGGTISNATKLSYGPCNPAADGIVTFNPGVYIVTGSGFKWIHVCTAGTGVVFYATATATLAYASCGKKVFSTDPPARYFLSAPIGTTANFKKWPGNNYMAPASTWVATSALPYEGLLFIQDRRQGSGATGSNPSINCDASSVKNPIILDFQPDAMSLDGAIYYPNHHIVYGAGTFAAGNYMILIGGTVWFEGTASFNSNFTGLASGSPIKRPGLGE
jgi:hypothetical protein